MAKDSGLIGIDFNEMCRKVGEQLEREQPERERQQRAAEERTEYEGQHLYHVIVTRPPTGGTKVESIEQFPLCGRLAAIGRNLDHALVELRWAYVNALVRNKLIPDWESARRYATKATFKVSLSA